MSSDDDDNRATTLDAFQKEERRMSEELHDAAEKHKQLSKECEKARRRNARLTEEFSVLTSGAQAMFLYAEQQRYKKMGAAWWICVVITLAFTIGTLQRGSYSWACLNYMAFLFVWRGLYVEINAAPMAAAICLALVTIKFA